MEAGIETTFQDHEWIVGLIDAMAPEPAPLGLPQENELKMRHYLLPLHESTGEGLKLTSQAA